MDKKVIYDEECDCEETLLSYYDEAGLTENITFEGDSLVEKRESAFNFFATRHAFFNIYCLSH